MTDGIHIWNSPVSSKTLQDASLRGSVGNLPIKGGEAHLARDYGPASKNWSPRLRLGRDHQRVFSPTWSFASP